jgi:hypothetical protein
MRGIRPTGHKIPKSFRADAQILSDPPDLLQPTIGRAEALRRAMLGMIADTANPWHAYPDYWAAFSVIGDG